jgi:hypothetical protein
VSDLIGAGTAETIVFIAATALAIASALGVVLSGNPFRSALWLILNLVSHTWEARLTSRRATRRSGSWQRH